MSDETIHLELEARTVTGKAVKQLRQQGIVPAVIHNHGKDSIVVQGPYLAMRQVYQKAGKHHPVNVTTGSRTYLALIKTATFEPKKNQLTHLVFNAVKKNQKVEAEVPIRPRYAEGNEATPAERASLIVLEQLDAVTVRAVPDKIPSALEYDAEKLVAVGDQVTVADLMVPDGVEIVDELEHPVATVFEPAALEAANNDAGGAEEAEASSEEAVTEESGDNEPAVKEV
ncbi:MAG TPA: 50S ribosomal protein L25 [Candidatus Saccharimonadales bacterium]|nr:50S ribosomal protein L25 [Candidatus Saccharimonadales bacterium]